MYKHTQIGYATGGALAGAALVSAWTLRSEPNAPGWLDVVLTGGLGLGAVLFSSLTVQVDREAVAFYFGPGIWRRRIPLDAIQRVAVVRNSVYYGWGIRYTPHGWLYNVSGLQAVELMVRGEGTIRIGTDEPERLQAAIEAAQQIPSGEAEPAS